MKKSNSKWIYCLMSHKRFNHASNIAWPCSVLGLVLHLMTLDEVLQFYSFATKRLRFTFIFLKHGMWARNLFSVGNKTVSVAYEFGKYIIAVLTRKYLPMPGHSWPIATMTDVRSIYKNDIDFKALALECPAFNNQYAMMPPTLSRHLELRMLKLETKRSTWFQWSQSRSVRSHP